MMGSLKNDLFYVIDLESSGLDAYRSEILTLSISACNRSGVIEELELCRRPTTSYWEEGAEKVHGISRFAASRFPDDFDDKLESFLSRHGQGVLVCHALRMSSYFDATILLAHFDKQNRKHDYYRYFRQNWSTITFLKYLNRTGVELNHEFGLDALCKKYRIPLNHHDSKSDREACQKLFFMILSKLEPEDGNGLSVFCKQ
jgi:DNA polymerase III alpha subunit (gram-positive type)